MRISVYAHMYAHMYEDQDGLRQLLNCAAICLTVVADARNFSVHRYKDVTNWSGAVGTIDCVAVPEISSLGTTAALGGRVGALAVVEGLWSAVLPNMLM